MKVLMLKSGRDYDHMVESPIFNFPNDGPLRGPPMPDKPFGYYDATVTASLRSQTR